ncbi:MAG: hypothetical protein QM666_08450 [Acinetobacter sp.]
MKKLWVGLIFLALLWIVKLSYDQTQNIKQIQELQNRITLNDQSNAYLTDQLVALQRQTQTRSSSTHAQTSNIDVTSALNPINVVKQQLNLVQFALQQQQDIYAFEQLKQLSQQIPTYALSPAIEQGLIQALSRDLSAIQQYHDLHQSQRTQSQVLLAKIDQQFSRVLNTSHAQYQKPIEKKHFWENWVQVSSTAQQKIALMDQRLVVKEAQLRLLLAQEALASNQYDEFQQSLNDIILLLQQAPALNQPELRRLLEKAKALPMTDIPKLSAMALLN